MKTPFSKTYIPPAPILVIALAVPDESPRIQNIEAFVDTGADMTIVPTSFVEELGVPSEYSGTLRAFVTGSTRRVSIHTLDILIDRLRFPSIDVISDDMGDQVILGRNFLNKMRLVLDGPKQMTEL